MPSTTLAGATATITIGTATMNFFAVSVNDGPDMIDVSHFGNLYRTRILGLKDLTGTVSAYAASGAATNNPFADLGAVSMTLTCATGCTITATVVLGNRTLGFDVNGAQIVTWTFSNTGETPPAFAWA